MNTNEGADNTVFGSGSMYTNTSGSYNTAIGRYSLTLNTTGNNGFGNSVHCITIQLVHPM